ncbi:MAG TPA: hypothetical protein VGS19_01090 [Streptosporangiaceae bacterium]|nr:hypothetical protein [Streptosporangiaceae bacterium]
MFEVGDSGATDNQDSESGTVTIATAALGTEVESMLRTMGPELDAHELLVLPPYEREGRSYYGDGDLDALRLARELGISAAFLHSPEDREYLQEYSAGFVVEFAVSVGEGVTAISIGFLAKYVLARARQALHKGLHAGPEKEIPLKLTVATVRREKNGSVKIKGLKVEGPAGDVAGALHGLLDTKLSALEGPSPVALDGRDGENSTK